MDSDSDSDVDETLRALEERYRAGGRAVMAGLRPPVASARGYQIRLWLGPGGSGWLGLLTTLGWAAGTVSDECFRV